MFENAESLLSQMMGKQALFLFVYMRFAIAPHELEKLPYDRDECIRFTVRAVGYELLEQLDTGIIPVDLRVKDILGIDVEGTDHGIQGCQLRISVTVGVLHLHDVHGIRTG